MLPEFISFRKSLNQRKKEYEQFYSSQESCSNVYRLWAFDLDLAFDNNVKWQALWLMSEESCRLFRTLHPTTVVVTVQEVVYEELSAVVVVEAVQEDLEFPAMLNVPLFELFPTKAQSRTSFSIVRNIADWLDRCRFFFLYLWYPWDSTEEMPLCNWAQKHLDNRLKLQYDIRSGVLDKSTTHYIQYLLSEALEVFDVIEESEDSEPNDDEKLTIIKNLIHKENIKLELGFFEAPELRAAMIAYTHEKKQTNGGEGTVALISNQLSLGDLALFVTRAQGIVPSSSKIHISSDIQHTLDTSRRGGTVLLSPETHKIAGLGNLAYGCEIRGMGTSPIETVITPSPSVSSLRFMFLTCFGSVLFKNISIERAEGVQICASEGVLRMEACHLMGKPGSLGRGVVVQPGCRLEMVKCYISHLGTAVIAKKNATVSLQATSIENCEEGLKVMDGAKIALSDVLLKSCSVAGIVLETSAKRDKCSGHIDILSNVSAISVTDSRFELNKVNALISPLPQEFLPEG